MLLMLRADPDIPTLTDRKEFDGVGAQHIQQSLNSLTNILC